MPAPPGPRAWPGSPVPRWRWCPRARAGPARAPARSHKPSGQSTAQRSSSPPPPRRPPSVSPDSKGDRQSSWRWCSHASPAAAAIFAVLSPTASTPKFRFPIWCQKWISAVRGARQFVGRRNHLISEMRHLLALLLAAACAAAVEVPFSMPLLARSSDHHFAPKTPPSSPSPSHTHTHTPARPPTHIHTPHTHTHTHHTRTHT